MKKITALAIAGVFTASLAATAFAESDVKVGGEIRVRHVEQNNNTDFNNDAGDAGNTTAQRTRVNVDAKINETTKAYISIQDTRVWGDNPNTTAGFTQNGNTVSTANGGAGNVDLSQAYVQLDQLFGQPLSLRLGRQMLAYGDHRLIGNFEWSNFGRRFDAIKLMYNTDALSVDLFAANVSEGNGGLNAVGAETAAAGRDAQFNGLYATLKMIPMNSLDLYLLQKKEVGGTVGQSILTYGARLNGGAMNIDWTAEAAIQSGDHATSVTKEATMYALKAGYTLPEVASLRIGAEYDFASGDDGSDATKNKAFDNLFPTNHPLYGVTDIGQTNALTNLRAWSVNVGAKPAEGLKVVAEYWSYMKDKENRRSAIAPAANDLATATDKIGSEYNVQAWYALNKNVDLHAYWARFNVVSEASASGKSDAADNVTLQLAVKF